MTSDTMIEPSMWERMARAFDPVGWGWYDRTRDAANVRDAMAMRAFQHAGFVAARDHFRMARS